MILQEMFTGMINSTETVVTNVLSATDTVLYVQDDTRIPEAPNLLVIGGNLSSAETVKLIAKDGIRLTVERGYQGSAKNWPSNTIIARNFTDADYQAIISNINTLGTAITESTSYNGEFIGDGVTTSFTINHTKNTLTPLVGVFDAVNNMRFYPEIDVISANEIQIVFMHPLQVGRKLSVAIS